MTKNQAKITTIRLTTAALFMAMNIALSSFGIPVPGGHLYLCDIAICTAALLLNPFEAFLVGGIGSFLGDMIFYPLPMFVSLFTHGIQALVISFFAHYTFKKHPKVASAIGVAVGAVIMVAGYTFGKAFIYSTPEYAIIKLPYEIAQGVIGAVFGMLLVYRCGLKKLFNNIVGNSGS
ncbi:MAG: ECF transporter S component [Lachnospiraceae bacterium]|nr:ECF transporter S component [Lachnospiraceae bacterium]